jgi:hypothetical protein
MALLVSPARATRAGAAAFKAESLAEARDNRFRMHAICRGASDRKRFGNIRKDARL